ncbi:MAG: long-chain fatty acid--CoA ligase [FCB group bacterium]|nr:long-chain fatty acid--CoA ligase [FCB group bacterium]MBL7028426.1 long-chain fatty acid--CoA ligase [Candidatus Neomarinimicrobiota bacterium]MBL7122340.1 long-chain fatty acid--CoA ligase [Candidatus Neomarinimicrobiota bacterium]
MTQHAHDWLARWAFYTPDKKFLREHVSDRSWTYGQFNEASRRCARYLQDEMNLSKGDRLAIYSSNRIEYFMLYFAAIKLGVIVVPLNFRLTPIELDVLLKDAEPQLMVFEGEYSEQIAMLHSLLESCQKVDIESLSSLLFVDENTSPIEFTNVETESEDLVMILYTSGTTGVPKGAMITHKMLFWNSVNTALRLDINSSDHTQAYAPLFHTGGWNVLFTPFLQHGASHTILEGFDPDLILELIEKEGSTILFGVPTMMQMLADSPRFKSADLSSIRYAVVGGAPMPIPLIEIWHAKNIPIRQGYGLTEVGPNCFSLNQDAAISKQGSIGFPNFYMDACVLSESGAEVDVDEAGELCLRSPVVTPGYWRKSADTQKAIIDGWFHTGDMARKDKDGYFYIVDRKKNMFISGGENVYPAEVEATLIQHLHISDAAVIGIPDEKWGEVGLAFIVADRPVDIAEVREFCLESLAKYKIPKQVCLIEALPLNDSGKLDRKQLIEIYKQQKETR